MSLIIWTDLLSVKVPEIDLQHKKLVEIINKLYEAVTAGKSKDVIGEILISLISYTLIHFKTEEMYFEMYNFPEKGTHEAEHKKFIETVKKLKTDYDSGNATMSFGVIILLRDWLIKHISGEDKKYSECFNAHGLK